MEPNQNLLNLIQQLQEKVKYLEQENIETTNVLYELQNHIDMVESKVEIIENKLF